MCLCGLLMLIGCARNPKNPDPLIEINRWMYGFNEVLDRHVLKPASDAYIKLLPEQSRRGIGNAFDNLGEPYWALNHLLQGRFGRALGSAGRFGVNSTVGAFGLSDVAGQWGIARHKNDLGRTLGKAGVGPGPYLVLPLFGPSTARDAPGLLAAMYTNPMRWVDLTLLESLSLTAAGVVDSRWRIDPEIRFREKAAIDPYVFTREAYLQRRNALIRGEDAQGPGPDPYEDPAGASTQPAAVPAPSASRSASG